MPYTKIFFSTTDGGTPSDGQVAIISLNRQDKLDNFDREKSPEL